MPTPSAGKPESYQKISFLEGVSRTLSVEGVNSNKSKSLVKLQHWSSQLLNSNFFSNAYKNPSELCEDMGVSDSCNFVRRTRTQTLFATCKAYPGSKTGSTLMLNFKLSSGIIKSLQGRSYVSIVYISLQPSYAGAPTNLKNDALMKRS